MISLINLEVFNLKKTASILDFSYPGLDPNVFGEDGKLLPEHRDLILNTLSKALTDNLGTTNDEEQYWINSVNILGSITTYRYTFDSDIDIHVKVNLPEFIKVNKLTMSEQEAHDYLDALRKKMNETAPLLNGTQHPVEFYFETPFVNKEGSPGSGVYDVHQDTWEIAPVSIDKDFDIEEIRQATVDIANTMADEIEIGLGRMDRHVRRIEELQNVVKAWDTDQKKKFEDKLTVKLQEIETEIKKQVQLLEQTTEERRNYNPEGDAEIKFKYLQKFGYLTIINELKKFIEDDGKITEDEIPEIKKVLDEAKLGLSKMDKKAFGKGSFWITPSGEIQELDEGQTHQVWLERNKEYVKKNFADYDTYGGIDGLTERELIQGGWIRIAAYTTVVVPDIRNIPTIVESFLQEHYRPGLDPIFIGDNDSGYGRSGYVELSKEDLVNLQKSVNRELTHKKVHADFSPSIALSPPNNHWDPDSNVEIPVDPDPESDEETWENGELADKPRKSMWKRILDLIIGDREQDKDASENTGHDYSCVMANIPNNIGSKVQTWGNENIPDDDIYEGTGDEANQFGRENETHVTVLYGLHTNEATDVKELFKDQSSPKIKLGKVKHFSNEDKPYDVIVVEIDSPDLRKLNKLLTDNLEYTTEYQEYNPHMTIAYVKKGKAEQYDGQTILDGEEVESGDIVFSPAEGNKDIFKLKKEASPPPVADYKEKHIQPLGVTEFLEFYDVAPQEAQDEVDALLEEDKTKEAWVLMEKYLGRSHLKLSKDTVSPTTWDRTRPKQENEPFSPLPTTFKKDINEDNLNWRFPWKFMGKPKGPNYSNEREVIKFLEDMPMSKNDKKASNVDMVETRDGVRIVVLRNPSPEQASNLFSKSYNHTLKWFLAPDSNLFIWDAFHAVHHEVLPQLGYDIDFHSSDYYDRTGIINSEDEAKNLTLKYASMPLSKNDKKASGSFRAWIDPNGEIFKLNESKREMHGDWIRKNKDILEKDHGLNFDKFTHYLWTNTIYYLIENGWTRVHGGSHHSNEWNITTNNIKNLSNGTESIIPYISDGDILVIEVPNGDSVIIESYNVDDDLQHQINRALQQKRLVPASMPLSSKQSSVYTDKEMEKIYVDQHEMADDPGQGGGHTPHDWNQSTTDFPKPEDLERPKVHLDRWHKTDTPMASYEVTWYLGMPKDTN